MKIGIVGGYGHLSVKHYPGVTLIWALDGYDEAVVARADGATVHPSLEAMIAAEAPDLVYIGTAYGRNGLLAVRALELGVSVVCEKPMAADEPTLERLHELTADGKRRIVSEFAMRWSPAFVKARELITGGAIGEPVLVQAQKSYKFGTSRPEFYQTRALFGGIIPWVAMHAIDFASWCTGLAYEGVTSACHGNRCFPDYPEMEDYAALTLRLQGGVPCLITADFLRPAGASTHGDDRLRVTGTRGVVEVTGTRVSLTAADGEQGWDLPTNDESREQCAIDLVEGALGRSTGRAPAISMDDSFQITAIALEARALADSTAKP